MTMPMVAVAVAVTVVGIATADDLAVLDLQAVPLRALALTHVLRALRRAVLRLRGALVVAASAATPRHAAGSRTAEQQERQDGRDPS